MIEANWLIFIAALLVGIAVAYWVFVRSSKPARRDHRPDVLDEGAAPAQRNQALIDVAPPAAQFHIDPPAMAGTMAGLGEVIAAGAQAELAHKARAPLHSAPPVAKELPVEAPIVTSAPKPVEIAEPQPVAAVSEQADEAPQTIAAEPDPTPAPPASPILETADGDIQADDLRKIKGLGPKMLTLLHALGITTFAQVAAWTDADLDELDTRLGAFAGRPRRDSWVEQAQFLVSGDIAAYEAKFGKV